MKNDDRIASYLATQLYKLSRSADLQSIEVSVEIWRKLTKQK